MTNPYHPQSLTPPAYITDEKGGTSTITACRNLITMSKINSLGAQITGERLDMISSEWANSIENEFGNTITPNDVWEQGMSLINSGTFLSLSSIKSLLEGVRRNNITGADREKAQMLKSIERLRLLNKYSSLSWIPINVFDTSVSADVLQELGVPLVGELWPREKADSFWVNVGNPFSLMRENGWCVGNGDKERVRGLVLSFSEGYEQANSFIK